MNWPAQVQYAIAVGFGMWLAPIIVPAEPHPAAHPVTIVRR